LVEQKKIIDSSGNKWKRVGQWYKRSINMSFFARINKIAKSQYRWRIINDKWKEAINSSN
jgi:hypothetical protein